jgi:hypothetical protein
VELFETANRPYILAPPTIRIYLAFGGKAITHGSAINATKIMPRIGGPDKQRRG